MSNEQLLKNLQVRSGKIDVILDTDTYNEIDDQYAIAYLLKSEEKINVLGLTAAPFHNDKSNSAGDGMEKSYQEIKKLLALADRQDVPVFKGSDAFLTDESTPIHSDAVDFIITTAMNYSVEKPLYIAAIGAITNIASALIINPEIAENIVIVWLGGHSHEYGNCREFNMIQDVAAARVVMLSKAPFVQLPCKGVVSELFVTKPELKYWLLGKNMVCDYLVQNAIQEAESYAHGKPWSRVIWDVSAIAWLLNEDDRFMESRVINTKLPQYDGTYSAEEISKPMRYVYSLKRDNIIEDLFKKLS